MMQAAQQVPDEKPPLWRDLNVFVAAFAALAFLAGFVVFVPLSLLLKLVLPARQAEIFAYPLGYALVVAGLGLVWWKHGLSPRQLNPALARRFQVGHVLLAVFNITMVAMFLGTSLGVYSLLPRMPSAAGVIVALMSLAPVAVPAGLVMVWSARGTAPAFADTLPAAPATPIQAPSAKWPPEPTRAGRAPSFLVVVAGLVVSSYVLLMAGVFGAIAFTNYQKVFSGIVLPIAGAVYILYVTTAFWLLTKRNGAANWVAWAPVILVIVTSTVGQVIGLLIG